MRRSSLLPIKEEIASRTALAMTDPAHVTARSVVCDEAVSCRSRMRLLRSARNDVGSDVIATLQKARRAGARSAEAIRRSSMRLLRSARNDGPASLLPIKEEIASHKALAMTEPHVS